METHKFNLKVQALKHCGIGLNILEHVDVKLHVGMLEDHGHGIDGVSVYRADGLAWT
jgi:hypothetical protein